MKRNTWFRAYSEMLDDPKVQRLHPVLFKAWMNILCLACENDGLLPSDDDIAFRLRCSPQDAKQHMDELILAGLVDLDSAGKRSPHNWNARQFVSDSSTDRVRKFRMKRKDSVSPVPETPEETTPKHDETFHETTPEQSRAETEQIIDNPPTPQRGPTPLEALRAYEAYNATALRCGLPQAAKLTPDRQRKIIARLRDYGDDGWAQALANIERSSFLTGKNDRGWRVNLEFLLQPTSFAKVHDGGYGNGRHTAAFQTTTEKPRGPAPGSSEYLEQLQREMGLS